MLQQTVSVIVPVYNAAKYLKKCIDSIINQSFSDLEIILVDDGATDESPAICDEYAKEDARIRVIHKENGGLMSAWMEGVCEATGKYLCFVDSDDWIDNNMIEEMMKGTSETEEEIVCCNFVIEKDGKSEPCHHSLNSGVYKGNKLWEVKQMLLGNEVRKVSFSRCMKLISRNLIVNNLHFCNQKIQMGEDLNIMLPALLDTQRLVIMEDAYYYHYYYNQSSIVHKYDAGLYDNVKLLKQVMVQVLSEKFEGSDKLEEMRRRADMEYIFLLMLVLKNEARGNKTGYRKNIREVCREKATKKIIENTPVKTIDKANQLLYAVMKHPNLLMTGLLRLSMVIYYR
ncbi:MAG: glycosyltransferase family 2 protein [Suilimivivens sp.]